MTMRRDSGLRSWIQVSLVATAFLAIAPVATAGTFLPALTGNTRMSDTTSEGVISFGVYRPTSPTASWLSELRTTIGDATLDVAHIGAVSVANPAIDTTAEHVFLYQVVNIGLEDLTSLSIPRHPTITGAYSSAGYFITTGDAATLRAFFDGAAVGPGGNSGLGPNPGADDVPDGFPSSSGVALGAGGLVSDAAAIAPTAVGVGSSITNAGGSVVVTIGGGVLPPGTWSGVFFLTSDMVGEPTYDTGRTTGSGGISDGDIPRANPEPSSMVLLATGLLGMVGYLRKVGLPVG